MTAQTSQFYRKYWLAILALFLLFTTIFIFYLNWRNYHREFTFAMLDVGQGDALFIESPTGTQILVDAGPPRRVLGPLAQVMPPLDRSLDAIIITNPDQDHIGGFLDVLQIYEVGKVFEPGTFNESQTYENLKTEIKNKNIPDILARQGMRLHLGSGAVLDILFPDRDVSEWDSNDGSIIAKLTYGETTIMLTGDATMKTEKFVLEDYPQEFLDVDILKVGHHGSRTSTGDEFAHMLTPEYALISEGKDNKYGHPHTEVLDTLAAMGAKILRTDTLGTIVVNSDGKYVKIRP